MSEKVQVILSTYNGEKYIEEQINSILNQTYSNVHILIRDDGSSDHTIEIIERIMKTHENIKFIQGDNVGVIKSFFSLMCCVDKDTKYISLADQDDMWLPLKIERAVLQLESMNQKQPLLYCSASTIVNERLVPENMNNNYHSIIYPAYGNALVENICTGNTAVFNRELLELVVGNEPEHVVMHDFWIYIVGSCFGQVIYDKSSYILYRQHEGNVIGSTQSMIKRNFRRFKNFTKFRGQLSAQANELIQRYDLPKSRRTLASDIVNSRKSLVARMRVIKNKQIYRQNKSDNFILKFLVLLGLI